MAKELAFVLINPYTIRKSRTGGIIARYLARTDLDLVGARMFGPGTELAETYSEMIRKTDPDKMKVCGLMADYILKSFSPDSVTGRVHRVMLLLFEGENAVEKIWKATGSSTLRYGAGGTIRDTYGDYVKSRDGEVHYYEPAVFVAPTTKRAAATLGLWVRHSEEEGGVISSASDVPDGEDVEKTLVLLKPDNLHVGEVVLEVENVLDVRAAPSVDGLIRIARHGQVGMRNRKPARDRILRQVRILIFVD